MKLIKYFEIRLFLLEVVHNENGALWVHLLWVAVFIVIVLFGIGRNVFGSLS